MKEIGVGLNYTLFIGKRVCVCIKNIACMLIVKEQTNIFMSRAK